MQNKHRNNIRSFTVLLISFVSCSIAIAIPPKDINLNLIDAERSYEIAKSNFAIAHSRLIEQEIRVKKESELLRLNKRDVQKAKNELNKAKYLLTKKMMNR